MNKSHPNTYQSRIDAISVTYSLMLFLHLDFGLSCGSLFSCLVHYFTNLSFSRGLLYDRPANIFQMVHNVKILIQNFHHLVCRSSQDKDCNRPVRKTVVYKHLSPCCTHYLYLHSQQSNQFDVIVRRVGRFCQQISPAGLISLCRPMFAFFL